MTDNGLLTPVLVADDGELDDVRSLLEELGIPYGDARCAEPLRASVLISTPRYALPGEESRRHRASCSFHIVVADKLSRTVATRLQRSGCDFVVQRPVHPAAMRLLIQHALYTGPEKRRSERVAMSAFVKVRAGLRSRSATLLQLSPRGCRLESRRAFATGQTLTVILPGGLTGGRGLSLEGRVVSTGAAEVLETGVHHLSVAFRPADAETRRTILRVMASHAVGSAALRPAGSAIGSSTSAKKAESGGREPSQQAPTPAGKSDRRAAGRRLYTCSALAATEGTARTVLGRDLSARGMRIAPEPSLDIGQELKLAIYGHGGQKPILVKAVVARDDGERGCVLHFRDLSPHAAARLEKLLLSLVALPTGDRSGTRTPNQVVSEILEEE